MQIYYCKRQGMVTNLECMACFEKDYRDKGDLREYFKRPLCKHYNVEDSTLIQRRGVMSETTGNIKEKILPLIKTIKINHPRGEEYLAKMSKSGDCFAIAFDVDAKPCSKCTIEALYEGKKYILKDLCKHFMTLSLATGKPKVATAEETKVDTPAEQSKKDAKPEATKEEKKEDTPKKETVVKDTPKKETVVKDTPKKATQTTNTEKPLTPNQTIVYEAVKAGNETQAAIAKAANMAGPSVNTILRKLASLSLIARAKKEGDKSFTYSLVAE